MRFRPMHPRAFQARLDHQFGGTFHHATANRPLLGQKPWLVDLITPLLQIGQLCGVSPG
jgi:hypothetical protein